jgi:carboxyl-terminal processing protease
MILHLLLTFACSLTTTATAQEAQPPDLTAAEKVYGLSTIWSEAKHHFPFFDQVPDLDWDAAYREYLDRVLATTSKRDYYRELSKFIALLQDGHSDISFPRDVLGTVAYSPLAVASIGERVYVVNILEPLAAEIPPGSEIVAVEGTPLRRYFEERLLPVIASSTDHIRWETAAFRMTLGAPGSEFRFSIVTPADERRDVSVKREGIPGAEFVVKRQTLDLEPGVVQYKDLGSGIAYVALNTFRDFKTSGAFEELVPKLASARGIILDLRNNGGGNDEVAIRIVRHFTRGAFKNYAWKTRETRSAYRAWGKMLADKDPSALNEWEKEAVAHYRGESWFSPPLNEISGLQDAQLLVPTIILTGHNTASAAEDMLIYMDGLPNVTRVGQRTYGSTGQPYHFDLPGGGRGRIVTMRLTFPDGRDFVGIGVLPHIEYVPTVEDWVSGRDAVLQRGLEVLRKKIGR